MRLGGKLNPIHRTSHAIEIHKTYLRSKLITENSSNISGGSQVTDCVPIGGPPPNQKKLPKSKTVTRLLNDSDLFLAETTLQEKNLLKDIGLHFESQDDVYTVKDNKGNIKSAFALKTDKDNNTKHIRYIDIHPEGNHFKGGLVRLSTLPNGISFYSSKIEVHRDPIREDLIV